MARIDYCDPAKASERTREILDKNRKANIFRMMAHSPSYFEQYCRLGRAIRHKGELDPIVRELAPSCARLLPGHLCVRIGCVSICVPVAQDMGSKLGAGSFTKVFGYLDEPLLSRCAEWTRSAEYLRRLRRADPAIEIDISQLISVA